ncbi:MAG TPA: hypothetical protein VJR02_21145 [Pyrinomonadaceae bacterium]|nr:hypothetical protein [Pyrinomonadaceae bacterium]
MANDSSATVREIPHVHRTSRTNTIMNALKERAQAVLNDFEVPNWHLKFCYGSFISRSVKNDLEL